MTILSKTRKNLWAKSGNRCAICKVLLFTKNDTEDTLNIGEECHIISSRTNGPRYKEGLSDYDTYDNLLLLCANHHKEIDTLTDTHTEELLRYIKTNHENWVSSTLDNSIKKSKPRFIYRITSGKELSNILSDIHGYKIDYDEPDTQKEADYIGGVLQSLIDYGDLMSMTTMGQNDKVQIGFTLNTFLSDIENKGFFLFADKNIEEIKHDDETVNNWSIVTLLIRRKDNEEIIKS